MTTPGRFRHDREAEEFLLGFVNYEAIGRYRPTTETHDLAAFESRLRALGWRPRAGGSVHVGGTNGKGTVSALLEAILRAGGVRTGLYTSPHLLAMRERIRIRGRALSPTAFCRGVERLAEVPWGSGGGFRTTFEHLTALAFLEFQNAGVETAVVEVGLGGTLDATNILPPGPALLTPISLDHRQILGRTVGRIAADKAGILKRGGAAYVMPQRPEAWRSIELRCRRQGLTPVATGDACTADAERWGGQGTTFAVRGASDYGTVATGLLGVHQADNVAAAVSVAEAILTPDRLGPALRRGLRGIRVPGRLDPRSVSGRDLLFDGGHNPAAGRAIAKAVARHYPGRRVAAVVGMARDKDHRGFLGALGTVVGAFHYVGGTTPRSAPPELLRERNPRGGRIHPGAEQAMEAAFRDRADLILVTGSFVLVGEILRRLGLES